MKNKTELGKDALLALWGHVSLWVPGKYKAVNQERRLSPEPQRTRWSVPGKMTSMVLVAAIFLTTSQSHSRISLSSPFLAILNSWQLSSIESQGRPEAGEFPASEKTCWRKDRGAGGATCYTQELSYTGPFTPPVCLSQPLSPSQGAFPAGHSCTCSSWLAHFNLVPN